MAVLSLLGSIIFWLGEIAKAYMGLLVLSVIILKILKIEEIEATLEKKLEFPEDETFTPIDHFKRKTARAAYWLLWPLRFVVSVAKTVIMAKP